MHVEWLAEHRYRRLALASLRAAAGANLIGMNAIRSRPIGMGGVGSAMSCRSDRGHQVRETKRLFELGHGHEPQDSARRLARLEERDRGDALDPECA